MKFIEAAHHWTGREGQTPKYIVLHGTAGGTSSEAIANYFANPATEASAHVVIGTDGTAVQCVQYADAAWANGYPLGGAVHDSYWDVWINAGINLNLISIAIEHCKASTDNSDQLTETQQAASFQLIKQICEQFNIPKRPADATGRIAAHASIDGTSRARCPGPYPWDALWSYLKGPQPMTPVQIQEALDCWNSFFKSINQPPPPTGSGIYGCWLSDWITQGKQYGPPITHEYNSVNWDGSPIVVQEFAHARCEWVNNAPNWYGSTGRIS
jgi:N-acetyl-anhydromuramyl-L-alanine amidase AmpD